MVSPAPSVSPAASFRDPAGSLVRWNNRILRIVTPQGMADLEAFLEAGSGRKLLASGAVIGTRILDEDETRRVLAEPDLRGLFDSQLGQTLLEHERIAFPSYPYEWPPEMLHAAGRLTLDLARSLLDDHLGLKDGTPYNVLFRGPDPVFVDVLSFEKREPGDPTWLPYAQFVRTFLLPLLANRYYGLPLDQILSTRRDGLEPDEVYRWTKPFQRIRPPFLSLVSMPTLLSRGHKAEDTAIYHCKPMANAEKARFILSSVLGGLSRTLDRLEPPAKRDSTWSSYMRSNNNYTDEHFAAKEKFVREAVAEFKPATVLDVGCNTGHFSAMAARSGSSVIAIDYDPVVLGTVWRMARSEKLPILPLAVNLTRPTPGIGWRNAECPSFLDRARGKFDAVLMLAVIHHMLVTERVPLEEIIDLTAELTTRIAVLEFIAPEDSMFRRLVRGRERLHAGLNSSVFEAACARRFITIRVQHVSGSMRWLYLLQKR